MSQASTTSPRYRPGRMTGVKYPDLLIAFDVDPEAYRDSNAYIISEQGKPPDFVLEVASRRTGNEDTGENCEVYAALGIPEYWRFDETGEYHGTRLVGGSYEPVETELVLVPQPLGDTRPCGVASWGLIVVVKYVLDDAGERLQLGAPGRNLPPVARRQGVGQHLARTRWTRICGSAGR